MAWGKKPATAEAVSTKSSDAQGDIRAATAPEVTNAGLPPPSPPPPIQSESVEGTDSKLSNEEHHRQRRTSPRNNGYGHHDRKQKVRALIDDDEIGLDEEEMGQISTVKELALKLEMERAEKEELLDDNEQLRGKVAALKRKLLAAIAMKEKESKHANIIPVSVEANMNLKYQFQKRLLAAKEDYASLLDENRKLAMRVKELESHHSKRDVHVSKARLNEVLLWKKKYKDLELEKHKLEENFAVFVKKLERAEAERDKISATFNEAQIQFSQRLSYDTYSLGSLNDLTNSQSRKSLNRKPSTTLRASLKPRKISKAAVDDFEYDDVVRLQSPSAFTPKLKSNLEVKDESYDNPGEIESANLPILGAAGDKVKNAKTMLEHKAYVGKGAKS